MLVFGLPTLPPLGEVGRGSGRVGLFCDENCNISQTALPLSGPESPTLPEGECFRVNL
jgi:hypothetical protein